MTQIVHCDAVAMLRTVGAMDAVADSTTPKERMECYEPTGQELHARFGDLQV